MGDTTGEEGEDDEESAAYPLAMTSGSRVEKWRKRQWYQMEKVWLGNRRRHVAEGTINDSVTQTQSRRE
jgi:hypothetical protein